VLPSDRAAAGAVGVLGDERDCFGESARRAERSDPAVTERSGPSHRGVGTTADDQGDRRMWHRQDARVLQLEELAVEADRFSGEKAAQQRERLVGAASPSAHVDTAALEFVRILACDADAEREPAGREVRERRQLARHEHRVPQRQLIDADVHADAGMDAGEGRGGDQAVDAVTTAEGHVVDAADMVEAGSGRGRDRVARALVERFDRHDAKANIAHEIRPHHDRTGR